MDGHWAVVSCVLIWFKISTAKCFCFISFFYPIGRLNCPKYFPPQERGKSQFPKKLRILKIWENKNAGPSLVAFWVSGILGFHQSCWNPESSVCHKKDIPHGSRAVDLPGLPGLLCSGSRAHRPAAPAAVTRTQRAHPIKLKNTQFIASTLRNETFAQKLKPKNTKSHRKNANIQKIAHIWVSYTRAFTLGLCEFWGVFYIFFDSPMIWLHLFP